MTIIEKINRYFLIEERGSTLKIEILAGVSVYLSLAYIFVVNPAILAEAGMPKDMVTMATMVSSAFAMLLMGFWARLPLVVAPGLEMNSFFALVAVGVMGLTWQQGLGAVFWSGVLCLICTVIPLRQRIIDSIPAGLKIAISFSVGVFVTTIGLFLSGIVVFENSLPHAIGDVTSAKAISLYIGLALTLLLVHKLKLPFGFLVAIICATLFARFRGLGVDEEIVTNHSILSVWKEIDFLGFMANSQFVTVVIILFIIDFYGSIGKFIGLTTATNLIDNDGQMVDMKKALGVDSVGTMAGAVVGTSNLITYVESAIGIAMGGRTGIVAIVCALLTLASIVFTPLIRLVPVEATSGILIYVGYRLLPLHQGQKWLSFNMVAACIMGLLSFVTFSLDKALLAGFALYSARGIVKRDTPDLGFLLASTLVIFLSVAAQLYLK